MSARQEDGSSSVSNQAPLANPDAWWPGISVPRFLASTAVVTVLETTIFYPIELVKVRLQVNPQPQHFAKAFLSMANKLVAELGWRQGLFRGLTFACASSIPVQYSYIFAYNSSLKQLERRYDEAADQHNSDRSSGYRWTDGIPRALLPAAAGSAAEIASAAFHIPQEVVLMRVLAGDQLTTKKGRVGGSMTIARDVVKRDGLKGFYRGTGASLATALPSGMVWWVTYEAAKAHFASWNSGSSNVEASSGSDGPVSAANAAAAFLAGTAAAVSTNPLDLCKTRLQTQRFTYGARGIAGLLALAIRHEGVAVLWKGLQGRIVQFAPSGVMQGLAYEVVIHFSST